MSFTFRPAKRENVGLLISVAGGTGSGKTYSALRLATGLSAGEKFCMIDTESRRGLHYADQFNFDHGELSPPFRPERYAEAIECAVRGDYRVIVVDSASHEYTGDGGICDWHDEEALRLAKGDEFQTQKYTWPAWNKPKVAHKKMVQRLLSLPPSVHLILCLRAEEKTEKVKINGKTEIRPKRSLVGLNGWMPVCEKSLPFEMTLSFLLMADKPGIPQPIKLQEQHRSCVPLDKPIDEKVGEALAAWAAGGEKPAGKPKPKSASSSSEPAFVVTAIAEIIGAGTRRGVRCSNGKTYGTSDRELQEKAKSHAGTGELVRIFYKPNGDKLDFLGLEDEGVANAG